MLWSFIAKSLTMFGGREITSGLLIIIGTGDLPLLKKENCAGQRLSFNYRTGRKILNCNYIKGTLSTVVLGAEIEWMLTNVMLDSGAWVSVINSKVLRKLNICKTIMQDSPNFDASGNIKWKS